MKQEMVSAYRPICTADTLYGLVLVLDLGLMTKILSSHFLIGLKLFHVMSKVDDRVRVGVIATGERSNTFK